MKQARSVLQMQTNGYGLYDITHDVNQWVREQDIQEGLLTLFIRHTSASLVIQENADPDVLYDLENFMKRLVPENDPSYRHVAEGPDDMPAHIKSALTQTSIGVPLMGGRLVLGTWQGIYVFEHRKYSHSRSIALQLMGQ